MNDPEERIPCGDGCCVGTVNEKGFCNVCGRKKNPSEIKDDQERLSPYYYFDPASTADDDTVLLRIVGFLLAIGVGLFLLITFALAGWKFIKWAWE